MSPPSDMSTVYTTLKRTKDAINALGFDNSPVVFDMGLLTKALEITWSRPQELSGVIPCDGGMHLLMSLFAGIGQLFGDAGLLQLLHESGVYAPGTAQHILSGKDFDRAVRALKIVDEALNNRFMHQFHEWCNQNGKPITEELTQHLSELHCLFGAEEQNEAAIKQAVDILLELLRTTVEPLIAEFREVGRLKSPTFRLWDDFLQRIMLPLKVFLVATRNGDWEAHQAAKLSFLPVLFASNRSVYARYMPVLLLMMQRLPDEIKTAFENGQFVAKLTKGTFNAVWLDYTLETTANKSLKGNGGIIGLTLRGRALERWFLSRPITAKYAGTFTTQLRKANGNENKECHHLATTSEKKKWNTDVQKMMDMFKESYVDPFAVSSPPVHLVNFATGVVASHDIEQSLISSLDKGQELVEKFVEERCVVQEDGKTQKSFYAPLTRSRVKTMSDMNKTISVKGKKVGMNGEAMYVRLLAINSKKKVPASRVMSFENSPVPLSIFQDDGTMIGADRKADFLHKLEGLIPGRKITAINGADAIIFDAHAVIKALPAPNSSFTHTFEDMAKGFVRYILNHSDGITQIHVVFDKYEQNSTKNATREKRGMSDITYHITQNGRVPKNWDLFLKSGSNKSNLAKFYSLYMCEYVGSSLDNDETIYISGGEGDRAMKISKDEAVEVPSLRSNMEEADGRIILHAVVAADNGADTIIVSSPDTDVCVMLVHHRQAIAAERIFFLTGKDSKNISHQRYIPVHKIYDKLSPDEKAILLSVYCLSGCDTVSSFYGHGKATAFRVMKKHASKLKALALLGESPYLSQDTEDACIAFVGSMYGKVDCKSLNTLRCEKAVKSIVAKKLPPTQDSFHLHVLRALFQLLIWRNAVVGVHDLPEPTDYGFEVDGDMLRPKLMSQSLAAPELLNEIICICPRNSCHTGCVCLNNEQSCTAACDCEGALDPLEDDSTCTNYYTDIALQDIDED